MPQHFCPSSKRGKLTVPAITIFEVTKRARIMGNEADAQRIESHMRRFTVIDLNADRASAASLLSVKHKLPWQTASSTQQQKKSMQRFGL